MSFQQSLAKLANKEFSNIYLVLGEEDYLSARFKKTLLNYSLEEGEEEFNFISFDMEQDTLETALNEARTVPFFGDRKIVCITNPYFLTGEKKKQEINHNTDDLLNYLKDPSPESIVLFLAPYKKLDERKKIVKQLKKEAEVIDVSVMNEQAAKNYVHQFIKNEGYEISREAFDELIFLTDIKLSQLMHELEKLFLASFDTKKITKTLVSELVPKTLEHSIFDLLTYILNHKIEQAISLYKELRLQGESTIKINAILISQFRLLLQVKLMGDRHYQQSNMVDVLKIHPYRVKMSVQQVKKFTAKELGNIFDVLVDNDYKMKTGFMDQDLLFELFLINPTSKK